MIPYATLVVVGVCALTFFRMGRHERSWGLLWATLSFAASLVTLRVCHFGLLAVFAAQVLLFVAITAYRVWKSKA